ncbi:MAG: hypothetical protein AAGF35_12075 [Pseudomonadota bacterium]
MLLLARALLLLSLSTLAVVVHGDNDDAPPLTSDWMELVRGHSDPDTGVEVREVRHSEDGEPHTLILAIPKTSMAHPDSIEEVVVVGQRPEQPEQPEPLDIEYEWLRDYDNDNYGLVIRFGKESKWPIRLYLDSSPGYLY